MPRSSPTRLLMGLGLGLAMAFGSVRLPGPIASGQEPVKEAGWISLFNGKDLEGWTPKVTGYPSGENYADTFRVEDGVIKVGYGKYSAFDGKFGHLFSKQTYSNYKLRIEYRFVGDQCPGGPGWALRNSGVMIHAQSPEGMRTDQEFPVSVEAQFLGGDGKKPRTTGNVCSPGTHIVMDGKLIKTHCIDSKSKTYAGDQWVTAEVEVHGNGLIKHIINGETVLQYEKTQYDESDTDAQKLMKDGDVKLSRGHIALQAESHPIEFRKVEILPLEK